MQSRCRFHTLSSIGSAQQHQQRGKAAQGLATHSPAPLSHTAAASLPTPPQLPHSAPSPSTATAIAMSSAVLVGVSLPVCNEPSVSVVSTNNAATADVWVAQHCTNAKRLGFDTESKTVRFQKNQLAIIQLAVRTATGVQVLLYNMHRSRAFGPALLALLQDATVLKFAIDTREDTSQLAGAGVLAQGLVDLQVPVGSAMPASNQRKGTAKLVAEHLGIAMTKDKSMVFADWSRFPMDASLMFYATQDACIALKLSEVMRP